MSDYTGLPLIMLTNILQNAIRIGKSLIQSLSLIFGVSRHYVRYSMLEDNSRYIITSWSKVYETLKLTDNHF